MKLLMPNKSLYACDHLLSFANPNQFLTCNTVLIVYSVEIGNILIAVELHVWQHQ